jgi:hypothetical protein
MYGQNFTVTRWSITTSSGLKPTVPVPITTSCLKTDSDSAVSWLKPEWCYLDDHCPILIQNAVGSTYKLASILWGYHYQFVI